ncbi:MAG: DUF6036 family nucleotidyltransferase [Eubacteriales bacterium]|nr:DUF6036 family nucleotidyltransferase [Eubacteriales bacterium]
MSFESAAYFTKDNLDTYLKALAKEFRKLNGKAVPAEIVLIGGAAVLANYQFRHMTTDIDAIIHASSAMKDAISRVGDQYNLPVGWINADFMRTGSYSPMLDGYSEYYKTFSNVLTVRTISAEYLIAMKLRAGRMFKNDMSDILGILAEHEQKGTPITRERVEQAVQNLYGGWQDISPQSRTVIDSAFDHGDFVEAYQRVQAEELDAKNMLVQFEQDYPKAVSESNVNSILQALRAKTKNQSLHKNNSSKNMDEQE